MDEANTVGTAAAMHEMYTAPSFPNTFNITKCIGHTMSKDIKLDILPILSNHSPE